MKKSIKDLTDLKGKRVLVRVDVNVPLDENQNVTDDTRIRAILPTVNYLKDKGAKVVLTAHLGRPKGEKKPEFSLSPAVKRLSELLNDDVIFIEDDLFDDDKVLNKVNALKDGQVAMLENIRFYKGEEKNDEKVSNALAKLADVYVNDAFGAAHRAHSSTAGVAHLVKPAVSGFLMEAELNALGNLLTNPERPFTAIVGGAKVSSKIGVLENLLDKVDNLIIGGGMVFTFIKANGGKIGNSLCEDDQIETAKAIEEKAKKNGVNLLLAYDVVAGDSFSNDANTKIVDANNIEDGWLGLDVGPKTVKSYEDVIKNSKTILWNGPVGAFEMDKFTKGTKEVAKAVAEATKNGAKSVLGGGDTVAAAKKYGMSDSFTHISTGGGASLEFIEGKILPGVDALNDK